MHIDESPPARVRTRGRITRLTSPVGLILAGLCLLLPFLSASCTSDETPRVQWRITYTGADLLTGGAPVVASSDDAGRTPIRDLDDAEMAEIGGAEAASLPRQPLAWLAVALMVLALAAAVVPSPIWRTTATAGLAIAAAVLLFGATMLARQDATDTLVTLSDGLTNSRVREVPDTPARQGARHDQIESTFRYGYGLWTAIAALAAVGLANLVRVLRDPIDDRDAS